MAFSPETYALLKGQGGGSGSGLPSVTEADNGKVLSVVNGDWTAASGSALSHYTATKNGNEYELNCSYNDLLADIASGKLPYVSGLSVSNSPFSILIRLDDEDGYQAFFRLGNEIGIVSAFADTQDENLIIEA